MSELLKKTSKTYNINAIDTYVDNLNASKIADKNIYEIKKKNVLA